MKARTALAALPLLLGATACTTPTAEAARATRTAAPAAAASATRTTRVAPGTGGPGSVTVAIASPVTASGFVTVPVTSAVSGRTYRATASSVVVDGQQLSFDVRAAGYAGPGEYRAVVSATLVSADGTSTTVGAVPQVPASITETGGSYRLSATGTAGRTLDASVTWACSQ